MLSENERKYGIKVKDFLGRTFNFIRIKPKPKPKKIKYEQSNSAQGKRHKDETWDHFKERRRACNKIRREREATQ